LMVIAIAPKPLARWRSTGVTKTTLKKLNCTLPSLPARGQRRGRAAIAVTTRAAWLKTCDPDQPMCIRDPTGFDPSVASVDHRRWSARRARPSTCSHARSVGRA
jgi:hypothetical protein